MAAFRYNATFTFADPLPITHTTGETFHPQRDVTGWHEPYDTTPVLETPAVPILPKLHSPDSPLSKAILVANLMARNGWFDWKKGPEAFQQLVDQLVREYEWEMVAKGKN